MPFIYVITNKITGLKYIGKTEKTINERFEKHLLNSKYNKNNYLYKAIRKYGKDNFSIEIVEKITTENINEKEIFYINHFNTMIPNGYNLTIGGTGGDTSKSLNYIKAIKSRDMSGSNNPMFGKYGIKNPNYGKKRGKTPKISDGQKKNWEKNIQRKKLASFRILGNNNPMFGKIPANSKRIIYDGIKYNSINAAVKATGISSYFIMKKGIIENA